MTGEPVVFIAGTEAIHDPGTGHPESPQRLEAVRERVDAGGLPVRRAPPAERDDLLAVHPDAYLSMLESVARRGWGDAGPRHDPECR